MSAYEFVSFNSKDSKKIVTRYRLSKISSGLTLNLYALLRARGVLNGNPSKDKSVHLPHRYLTSVNVCKGILLSYVFGHPSFNCFELI